MSVAGSTSSQGTHSRSPSRSRSPPYSDGRYPNNTRYRYDYNYRPIRSGMSAALDDYRDMRERERDRDRDRPMGLRDDRYAPRGRERDDRYTPYYRDEHYASSSSSSNMPRDYPKMPGNLLRRDDKLPNSSSSSSIKDLKDDTTKPPSTSTSADPPPNAYPSSRYMDWRERERDRDRERRYRDDDRRRDYDRRRDGYMRYESSSYGSMNYQMPPFGDSYRPDRDMPPSPSVPYYERDRLDDRDFYRRSNGASNDYDRYRTTPGNNPTRHVSRPSWSSNKERMLDRDRPERIDIRSGRTSPIKERSETKPEEKKEETESESKPTIEQQKPEPMEIDTTTTTTTTSSTIQQEQDSHELEEGETQDNKPAINMTQEQIVERIDDIENQITMYEEMLELATKRESKKEKEKEQEQEQEEEDEDMDMEANKEEAKKQALQAMENEPSADMVNFADTSVVRKRPQLLINQLRSKNDQTDDALYEKILQDNRKIAQKNACMADGLWQGKKETEESWLDQENWSKPLYASIQDYPCVQDNIAQFEKLRISVAHSLSLQKTALKKKERFLKNEYKRLHEQWTRKNLALDMRRDEERKVSDRYNSYRSSSRQQRERPEEYVDNVIFISGAPDALRFKNDGASTPYGLYTSDAARSEAELLEIIQSLETAEMRNPESRAKKTTATIPPMILDERERMRTFDDRSGLVKDPLSYYHTGPDTGDVWNQQEVTTFMESYMMYPKQFERIAMAVGTKTACQCVLFYYRKKKKIDFKALMKKGRRGKATKHRDRIAAAIRAVTGDSVSPRKAKSKGSALMADIGEAQVSRKAKEKDAAERKSRELRDLEQANAYWDGVAERKKTKRPSSVAPSGPTSSASDDTEMMLQQIQPERRRTNSAGVNLQRRKGRSPREPVIAEAVLPTESTKRYTEETMDTEEEMDEKQSIASTKWSEREKEMAIEAFKQHGRDFVKVAGLVKTKTEEQCRNFYHNFKRKFGPNAFHEEETAQPILSPQDIGTLSGRADLKAEEEDAAAALVDMFQMGANTPNEAPKNLALPPSSARIDEFVTIPPSPVTTPGIAGPSSPFNQQKRRRVKSASSRAESVEDTTTEWASDSDYSNPRSGGRKLGRTSTLAEPNKRPTYSSYWSVSERNDFQRYLAMYGCDWDKVANAMKSKTVIQVRNFYANNEEKMQLKELVDRHRQQQQQSTEPARPPPAFEKSHFQALQSFPFPAPMTEQPSSTSSKTVLLIPPSPSTSYPVSQSGYYASTPPPPPPPPSSSSSSTEVYNNRNFATSRSSVPPPTTKPSQPPAVTKVADLLNNDDPAEPNQNSWETWFGS
ncbi:uncharacterized protein B0P05DRAFT_584621 [Gilbertella persicaria]|uniref:uncharacterized protein n=1 Tax=Gilbertella persicaria TaxID=101096 RepID=UPI00221EDBC3|nr:uncharacterized protein B0P05DRAFT_584621 [Gilbertella persicaria]KAI8087918.1 hypothetical protein B0P05DRAFT_584621 [Gilbertella persicaria]